MYDELHHVGEPRSDLDKIVEGTLSWCNDRRAEKGMEPLDDLPRGQRGNPESCPCGKATGLLVRSSVYDERVANGTYHYAGRLPEEVKIFTQQFDGGYLPEYDESEVT